MSKGAYNAKTGHSFISHWHIKKAQIRSANKKLILHVEQLIIASQYEVNFIKLIYKHFALNILTA